MDHPWDVPPDNTSKYSTFVWGLEKALLKNNHFYQMPRGIWLYQAAIRDVDILGNDFSEGGGVYIRAYQNMSTKMFDPIYDVRIEGNSASNTTGHWTSYVIAVFINSDTSAFGTAVTGLDVRDNRLVANRPNLSLPGEEYAGTEGFLNMMRMETNGVYLPAISPPLLGTIFQNNSCSNCAVDYGIGTGAGGTIISGAKGVNGGRVLENWKTGAGEERAVGTVVQ